MTIWQVIVFALVFPAAFTVLHLTVLTIMSIREWVNGRA